MAAAVEGAEEEEAVEVEAGAGAPKKSSRAVMLTPVMLESLPEEAVGPGRRSMKSDEKVMVVMAGSGVPVRGGAVVSAPNGSFCGVCTITGTTGGCTITGAAVVTGAACTGVTASVAKLPKGSKNISGCAGAAGVACVAGAVVAAGVVSHGFHKPEFDPPVLISVLRYFYDLSRVLFPSL